MSKRPKCRCSFALSATEAAVMSMVAMRHPLGHWWQVAPV
jgi:hypothetical protein